MPSKWTSERFEEKEVEVEVDMETPAEPQAFHCLI